MAKKRATKKTATRKAPAKGAAGRSRASKRPRAASAVKPPRDFRGSVYKTWLRRARRDGWSRWIQDERDKQAAAAGCVFDIASAERVFNFFERVLRHSKGQWGGQPFTLMDWQKKQVLGPIFGWKRPDGTRRYRRAHIEIAKKNGKSTMAAGVGLYMLRADGEAGAEVYSAATKRDQAAIVHNEAVNMVRASPMLSQQLKINLSTKTITHEATYSKYAALSGDAAGSEGLNIHCLIADELHVWKGREFWDSLKYGFAARRQPLSFVITTAGIADNTALGFQEHKHALAVSKGEVDDFDLFVYIAAPPPEVGKGEEIDMLSAKVHKAANPAYGITIDPHEMKRAATQAKARPTERGPFLRYRLNMWCEDGESFLDLVKWDAGRLEIDDEALVGRTCFAGLDLASKKDLAAWVLVFPPPDDDDEQGPILPHFRGWIVRPEFWVPKENAELRESRDGVPYATWGAQGHLNLTEGNVIDYEAIKTRILVDAHRYNLKSIGADPWQLEGLRQQIFEAIDDLEIVEFRQNFKDMSAPTKELEALVESSRLGHDGNPVLRWNAANAVVIEDGNANVKLSKKKSREKIDGIIALIMAIGRSMVHEEGNKLSDRLEKEGLIVI